METKEILERCKSTERELKYPPLNPTLNKEDIIELLHDIISYFENAGDLEFYKDAKDKVDSAIEDIEIAIEDINVTLCALKTDL